MNNLPKWIKDHIKVNAEYQRCSLLGYHPCGGRTTVEHVFTYAGRQIQEVWNCIPLCARGHGVDEWQDSGDLKKEMNKWVALNRATDIELREISDAVNYIQLRVYLNDKYGYYTPPTMKPVRDIQF